MPSTGPRVLADVNVWLATLVEAHPHHRDAIAWWQNIALPSGSTVFFCRVTQLGLLRLLTNPTVMGAARRTCAGAWNDYDQLERQAAVSYIDEPENLAGLLRTHTAEQEPSPSLWTDAYLAAFARSANLELATFDRGFRRFSSLRLHTIL